MTSESAAVYRMYDADGALLYIGVADQVGRRWEQHARTQPWWPDVRRQIADWYLTREAAESAERAAIKTEHPKYNVKGATKHLAVTSAAEVAAAKVAAADEGEPAVPEWLPDDWTLGTSQGPKPMRRLCDCRQGPQITPR